MRKIWPGRTQQDQLDYHLKRNDTPEFDTGQPGRIDLARFFIEKMLVKDLTWRPLTIVELGCGAGDVTGPFSTSQSFHTARGDYSTEGIEVIGIDVVPKAAETILRRYPNMTVLISPVEELEPIECDLLVMTEFLEHIHDPITVARNWMAKAKWALIGHPLDEPVDQPYEHGHVWSYEKADWDRWFIDNGFVAWERMLFPMGYWENMVMGHGSRKDIPPFASA